jgi:hypothetical protein
MNSSRLAFILRHRYVSTRVTPPAAESVVVDTKKTIYHMGPQSWHRLVTAGTFGQAMFASVLGPLVMWMPSELIPQWQAYAVGGFMMSMSGLAFAGWQTLLRRLVLQVDLSDDSSSVRLTHYTPWCTPKSTDVPVEALSMDVLRTKVVRNTKFYSVSVTKEGTNRASTFILPKDPQFCADYERLEFVLNGNQPYKPPTLDDDQSQSSSS